MRTLRQLAKQHSKKAHAACHEGWVYFLSSGRIPSARLACKPSKAAFGMHGLHVSCGHGPIVRVPTLIEPHGFYIQSTV